MSDHRSGSCPVLMYHKVGQPVASEADRFLNISRAGFERQIEALLRLGYRCRTFREVSDALAQQQRLPQRTFAITFDDGYRCVDEAAAPALARLGVTATLFAVPEYVGRTNEWDVQHGKPILSLMDWDAIRRLASAGWEIGNHTRSHGKLATLDERQALAEIRDGKEMLEAELDTEVSTFCYPYGSLNETTPALVQRCGLRGACTTRSGLAGFLNDPLLQPRIKVYEESVFALLIRILVRPRLPEVRRRLVPDRPRPRRYA